MATETDHAGDTSPQAKAKRDKLTIVIAVVGLVIGYLTLRKASGTSSGAAQASTAGSGYSYPMIGGTGASAAEMVPYDSSTTNTAGLSDAVAQLTQTVAQLQAPAASTSAPSGSTFVPTGPKVGSTAGSFSIPGFTYVNTPGAGSAYAASGEEVFALPAGMSASAGALVPYVVKGQVVNRSLPAGSRQYVRTS